MQPLLQRLPPAPADGGAVTPTRCPCTSSALLTFAARLEALPRSAARAKVQGPGGREGQTRGRLQLANTGLPGWLELAERTPVQRQSTLQGPRTHFAPASS